MHRLFPSTGLSNIARSAIPRRISGAAWPQRHHEIRTRFSRSLTSGTNHPPQRRQYTPEELLQHKKQAEAVSGELPSSPAGPSIGFGGYGGGGGNGIRDAILTTIFGVAVCEYSPFYGRKYEQVRWRCFGALKGDNVPTVPTRAIS